MATLEFLQPIQASPDAAWHYLATAAGLSAWQADEVTGSLEGRSFSFTWPALGARLDLTVAKFDPGKRLVLRAGKNAVTTEILLGPGGTTSHVRLLHEGLDPADDLEGLAGSWRMALVLLKHALETAGGAPRTTAWRLEPMELAVELVHYYLTEPPGLGAWLGRTARALETDERFVFDIEGERYEGKVLLAVPGRDVALAVESPEAAVVVLRTLPGPQGKRLVAASVSSFGGAPPERLLSALGRGLEALARSVEGRGKS